MSWISLNSDGAINDRLFSNRRGFFRDSQVFWLCGFHKNIGNCNSLSTEFQGVLTGLEFVWKKNIKRIIVQVHNKVVADLLGWVWFLGKVCL